MGYTWTETSSCEDQYERDLQQIFKAWECTGNQTCGRPISFDFSSDHVTTEHHHKNWGLGSRSDVFVDTPDRDHALVIELKLSGANGTVPKYEPLGIAEVLYYAECLTTLTRQVKAALVTRYNLWNRMALTRLNRMTAGHAIDYYEVDPVKVNGRACYWFDAPLVPWRVLRRPPGFLVDHASSLSDWLGNQLFWYEASGTRNIIATRFSGERPTVIDTPHLMAAPIDDRSGQYLVWAGTPPPRDALHAKWSQHRYWIAEPGR